MAIECNIVCGDQMRRQNPIEPGKVNRYYYQFEGIGRVVLVGCYDPDTGGRSYFMSEAGLDENTVDGKMTDEIEDFPYEVLGTGATAVVTIRPDGLETPIIYTHISSN